MYLFFDTETTGLPKNWKSPVHQVDNWPRLVQIAYLLYNSDGQLIDKGDHIIKPDGFVIPIEATRVHRISTEKAIEVGVSVIDVLQNFKKIVEMSDLLIAHNMSFDEKIVGAEYIRAGIINPLPEKKSICTMQKSVDYCAIKNEFGFKWPKLSELHQKLFDEGFEEAHNAAADIYATAKCFWELKRIGIL